MGGRVLFVSRRARKAGAAVRASHHQPTNQPTHNSQATVETVVKVSSKARADDARRPAADKLPVPTPPSPPPPTPPPRTSWWPDPHAAEKEARAAREAAAAAAVAKRVRDAGAAAATARAAADAAAASAGATEADVDRIIDSQDNEYVLSRPKDAGAGLMLDPQLVRDLTVVMAAATAGGAALESAGQPQISGYFLAGSAVGPGGLRLVKEIVQVESLAQLGVQLLLFTLGLESSGAKLRAVRGVALGGGAIQLAVFTGLGGVGARALGGSVALVRQRRDREGGGGAWRGGPRAKHDLTPVRHPPPPVHRASSSAPSSPCPPPPSSSNAWRTRPGPRRRAQGRLL